MNRNNEGGKKVAAIIKGRGNAEAIKFKRITLFFLIKKFALNKRIKRERERERERDTQTDRQTDRLTETDRERDTDIPSRKKPTPIL